MSTFTLSLPVEAHVEIRKSHFTGIVVPVDDRDSAMQYLRSLRERHVGATHICWALLAGGHSGMSDDGEPSGTAGRPIMEVIRHHELDGVLGIVIRYYGGVKLGTGGLVRAYTDAIALALRNAERIERVPRMDLTVEVDYADESRARWWVEQSNYTLVQAVHGTAVTLVIRLPSNELATAREEIQELTHGRARFGCLVSGGIMHPAGSQA